jgi:DNA-binding MurR/RpiR family transcriptional regulator
VASTESTNNDPAGRIQRKYAELTASERRIADLILGSPRLMIGFSLTELAELAEVSKATVSRFVNKLGFSSFDVFRHAIRDGQNYVVGSPLHLMVHELEATHGDLGELVEQTVRLDVANLEATYAELSMNDLSEAVRLLCDSRRVVFADFRKQFALAYYAATLFQAIRPNVATLPIVGASAVDGMLDVASDDLVVMFPFRRPERDHEILSRAVQASGATLVTIGDRWPNPAAERATIHFRCRTENVGVFDSFVTPISLINLLFTATANRLGGAAHERLGELEEGHSLFETFIAGYGSDGTRRRSRRTKAS